MPRLIRVIALLLLLTVGCATPVKNIREAKLMPAEVAKSILAKYAGRDWVANPTGIDMGNAAVFCPRGPRPLPFSKIDHVFIIRKKTIQVYANIYAFGLRCFRCGEVLMHVFPIREAPLSDEEIDDIVDALASLGAKITEAERSDEALPPS